MKKRYILYIFLYLFVPLSAQIVEDFSDGDFTTNPSWEGDLDHFIVNADKQLQLKAEMAGTSILYLAAEISLKVNWQFNLKMDFNPSNSNLSRIYLQADQSDLTNSSGYFLEIGESGNEDVLRLFRQDAGNEKLLASATLGAVANSPNVKVRVQRDAIGNWEVFVDYLGGNNLNLEISAIDNTYSEGANYFFGWYCKYTSTRKEDFFFDNLSIGNITTTNPEMDSTEMVSAEQYDLLINEIMEDPTINGGGTLGLPIEEYIELYNRSEKILNLEGWTITDGSRIAEFPNYSMRPKTYLIISKPSSTTFEEYGDFLGLEKFPSLSSEETLVLKDELGKPIDIVQYTQDWYRNPSKATGGYALERINPQQPCKGQINWQATNALIGGTPGIQNSVLAETTNTPLNIIDAYPLSPTQVRIKFDKAVAESSLLNLDNFSITNNEIIELEAIENTFEQVVLNLENPLVKNQIETISIAQTLTDCIGNPINGQMNYPIALPDIPNENDLIINEILFNPETGGKDFIELFNRSNKVFDLKDFLLANQAFDNPQIKPIEIERLIFPQDYIVLSEGTADIQQRYFVENSVNLFAQDLPTFGDKEGNVSLLINKGLNIITIDELDYTADWHNALLNDKNGVSLERINPYLPTQDEGNWQSASEESGYATPTFKNSQQILTTEPNSTNSIFTLSGNRISPDGDGFEDILQINYTTPSSGYSATIHIYDAAGRLIDKIAQNQLLSTIGAFKWEGTNQDGQKANIGIYVLWMEYVGLDGTVGQEKKAIVVAEKL